RFLVDHRLGKLGERFDAARYVISGVRHRNPGKRAKSRSNVIHSHPHSMASAANHASVIRAPRVSVWMHSCLKISQCRSPGSTIWEYGCSRRLSQKAMASSSALGRGCMRGLVVTLTRADNARVDKPNGTELVTISANQGRQISCRGESGRKA